MPQMSDGFMRGAAADIGPKMEFLLGQGQQVTLQVSGDSMRPALKPRRDSFVLERMDEWPPKKGDILLFRSERSASGYAVHRVVRVRPGGPMMNGDAQNWVEGPIPRDNVVGRAVALMRNGKLIDINKRGYRLYSTLWPITRPIRWPLFALWRLLKRIAGKK